MTPPSHAIAPPDDPPAAVRASCAAATQGARFVRIVPDALDRLADLLGTEVGPDDSAAGTEPTAGPPSWSDRRDLAARVFALDAINFGSGYHDIVRKEPGMSGARTMAFRLERYLDATGPLTAERLRSMTTTDTSQIFGQELDGGALEELMLRFAVALADLGQWLSSFDDDPLEAIGAAGGSATRLVRSLLDMPFYRDAEDVDGSPVHFYKRAQITAADLDRRLGPLDGGALFDNGALFDDLAHLTAFADNLVPHVLRVEGALAYDPDLAAAIDRGERLEPGSRAEIEIRAAGVTAVELLAARNGERPMDIDEKLWLRGGAARFKAIRRHRSRTVFY